MTETECAAQIRAYWRERGYDVRVTVEPVRSHGYVGSHARSDMVSGLPRDWNAAVQSKLTIPGAR